MSQTKGTTPAYEFYSCFFNNRLNSEKPIPIYSYHQDNVYVLKFQKNNQRLKLVMNLAYLKEKSLPTIYIFEDSDGHCPLVEVDGDLMNPQYFAEVDTLLEQML